MASTAFLDGLNHRDRVSRARSSLATTLAVSRRPIVSTKFSSFSGVLLHLVRSLAPETPVVWVDTGYNTRATRAFVDALCTRLDLEPVVVEPLDHIVTVPPDIDDPAHSAFVEVVKLEPFRRALSMLDADAWISSVRRDQTEHRQGLSTFTAGPPGVLKVAPILDWGEDDLRRYADHHGLPLGPACYDPTKGEPMRECGLHTELSA